jgi:hypothetical protein
MTINLPVTSSNVRVERGGMPVSSDFQVIGVHADFFAQETLPYHYFQAQPNTMTTDSNGYVHPYM